MNARNSPARGCTTRAGRPLVGSVKVAAPPSGTPSTGPMATPLAGAEEPVVGAVVGAGCVDCGPPACVVAGAVGLALEGWEVVGPCAEAPPRSDGVGGWLLPW